MKFSERILIDEFPDNESEVELCIFTRPVYPIQNLHRWKSNKQFLIACSPSAFPVFRLLKIKRAVQIVDEHKFIVNGMKLCVKCIKSDTFGSYMLIIDSNDEKEKDKLTLYTGQFTSYRYALTNGLNDNFIGKITDMYIDNALALTEHTNSLEAACKAVEYYLQKYEGHKIYLDMENLFGYEDLMMNLALRNVKIHLHTLQKIVMKSANQLHHFEFDGEPDLKVYHRPDGNNWRLKDYERFFTDDKCVYLKFIATQFTTEIESSFKGFHYIVYSPHASKYTVANFLRLVEPLRIHPIHMPLELDSEQSNVIPSDIIPNSMELMIPIQTEPELDVDTNETFVNIQNTLQTHDTENSSEYRRTDRSSCEKGRKKSKIPRKRKKEKSFLASSSEGSADDDGLMLGETNENGPKSSAAAHDSVKDNTYASSPAKKPKNDSNLSNNNTNKRIKSAPGIINIEPIETDEIIEIDDDSEFAETIATLNCDNDSPKFAETPNHENQIDIKPVDIQENQSHAIISLDSSVSTEINSPIAEINDPTNSRNIQQTGDKTQLTENQHIAGTAARTDDSSNGIGPTQTENQIEITEKENSVNEVNNNGQASMIVESAQAHCHDGHVATQAIQPKPLNTKKIRSKSDRPIRTSLDHRVRNVRGVEYLPETDDEISDKNDSDDAMDLDDSDSDTDSVCTPLFFK